MTESLSPEEARERLEAVIASAWNNYTDAQTLNAILTTTDALAVLLDPAVMLPAWERLGKVRSECELDRYGFYRATAYHVTDPGGGAVSGLNLRKPTICDMNCFYEPGHAGPHQKWLGDPCDVEGCTTRAKWRVGRLVLCEAHRKWHRLTDPEAAP